MIDLRKRFLRRSSLLNAKLPNGRFVIPTPQADGRYVGTDVSTYREDQFNINGDHQFGGASWLSSKFFYTTRPSSSRCRKRACRASEQTANRKISCYRFSLFTLSARTPLMSPAPAI